MAAEDELRLDRPVAHLRGLFLRPRAGTSVKARVTTAEIVVPLSRACARTRPASAAGSLTVNTTLVSGTSARPDALAWSAYRRACRAETPNRAASTRAASTRRHSRLQQVCSGIDTLSLLTSTHPAITSHAITVLPNMSLFTGGTPRPFQPPVTQRDIKAEVIYCVGGVVSPLLANVYLHYVLDLWPGWWRKRHARGDMIIVRFADDFIAGFEHLGDAGSSCGTSASGSPKFALELHPDKTRLIEFGRFAAVHRAARVLRVSRETFEFPGLHAHLREDRGGAFPGQADHDLEADAGEAERGQRPAQAASARARPGAGAVAGQRGARPYGLLRRARQHPGRQVLPETGDPALVRGSAEPQPAPPPELGPDEPSRDAVAPASPHPASLP